MKQRSLVLLGSTISILSLALGVACGSDPPPPPVAPPPPAPTADTTPPPSDTAKTVEPSPEEKKKADAAKQLEKDRAKMKADFETEKSRWTPELKTEATKLTDKAFPNGKSAVQAAMSAKTRRPGDADRDKFRHPAETLDFFGLKPTMTVIEYGPGDGWYTELLAPTVAKKGKLFATNGDPNGPPDSRGTFYAERFKMFLDSSPELFGKVETITVDGKSPALNHDNTADMIIATRELHGMVNQGKLDEWLGVYWATLKPNGILGIEEHRAPADANPQESSKKGYLPEKWTIEKIEAAGFKLAGKSEINANAKDTKDYPDGVWDLPPTLQAGDKDKDKYTAIGESDRMTLKFTKVAKKATASSPIGAPGTGAKPGAGMPATGTGMKPATTAPAMTAKPPTPKP